MMKKWKNKISLLVITLSIFISACNPNTGKNVGGGCGIWSEKNNSTDTTKVIKGS